MEENKVLFSNTSKLDKDSVARFNKVIGKKITGYAVVLIVAFCAVVGAMLMLVNLFLGITVVGVGVIVGAPLGAYLIKDNMKKESEKFLAGKKYLVHFEFCEENIRIKAEASNENESKYSFSGEEILDYSMITKIVVSDTDLYLQRQGRANIIDQKGMTVGTAGELIEFLRAKGIKIEGLAKTK